MSNKHLTEKGYWDKYWECRGGGTVEIKRTRQGLSINCLLDVFDKYLPVDENMEVLEIGGAPGQYLIYLHKKFKYKISSLDYSNIGNEKTRENLHATGIPVTLYERDLFESDFEKDMPKFDLVYSLGFIEHFEGTKEVVERHMRLLKPGGILMLGVPNLRGVYKMFLKFTAPKHLTLHNLNAMKLSTWKNFEEQLGLQKVFCNYIGGFEPLVMKKIENKSLWNIFLYRFITLLMFIFSFRFKWLRRFNSSWFSGYLLGIYKKGEA